MVNGENDILIPFLLDVLQKQGKFNSFEVDIQTKLVVLKSLNYIYKVEFIVFIMKYENFILESFNFQYFIINKKLISLIQMRFII